MTVGVKNVTCTCGHEMRRTGGVFGGDGPPQDTYYCDTCQKHIIILTPDNKDQEEFYLRLKGQSSGVR